MIAIQGNMTGQDQGNNFFNIFSTFLEPLIEIQEDVVAILESKMNAIEIGIVAKNLVEVIRIEDVDHVLHKKLMTMEVIEIGMKKRNKKKTKKRIKYAMKKKERKMDFQLDIRRIMF